MATIKQIEARQRNHMIMRLRGIYGMLRHSRPNGPSFTQGLSSRLDSTIDDALNELGAETGTDRLERFREEWDKS